MTRSIPKGKIFTPNPEEWELTFCDDFETLDRTKWEFDLGLRRACYNVDDDDIVFCKDSNLYIRTKWKTGRFGEGWYTALMDTATKNKGERDGFVSKDDYTGFSQTYGYFEARCKVPKILGAWSAFWLMPDNEIAFTEKDVQWSGEDGIEIDVMESPHYHFLLKRDKNQNIHVLHADGYDDRLKTVRSSSYYVPNMYDEFHTYGFLWEKDKYAFFIDGHKTWETTHVYKGHAMGISKVPEYLLLSCEVGGITDENGNILPGKEKDPLTDKIRKCWAGDAEKNDKKKAYDFIVDYVKVWKKK